MKGLCDVAAAFRATQTWVLPVWKNYTGCDSLFSTAADAGTAYFGGHERWSMNPDGCNYQGKGAYIASGMEGLSPTDGDLYLNSTQNSGYYERSRGLGADNMLLTRGRSSPLRPRRGWVGFWSSPTVYDGVLHRRPERPFLCG